mgnify:CR=1 FL=1
MDSKSFDDLKILNQSIKNTNHPSLKKIAFNELRTITIEKHENMLTFEFAALNFTVAENNQYQFESDDMFFADDRFVDGQDVTDLDVFGMSIDQYDEYKKADPNNQVFVKIEQLKVTNRYLKYLTLIQQQLTGVGSPFASPPAEIRGNVYKQGENEVLALGYFYTASLDTKSVEIIN